MHPDHKSNLIIFGQQESSRHVRQREDIVNAGELLTWLDPLVTTSLIVDSVRLGKYKEDGIRPLLIRLTRPSDVQSILRERRKLASKPGIGIKPDMTLDERKIESLLLLERRSLINSGATRSSIKISGIVIFVNKLRHGMVLDGDFKKCLSTSTEEVNVATTIDTSPILGHT